MLYELIFNILIAPVIGAVEPLRDHWSSLYQATAGFFWLFSLIFVPALVLAAPVAFGLEGLAMGRVAAIGRRVLVATGGSVVYALLASVMDYVVCLGSDFGADFGMLLTVPIIVVLPTNALGVFGFWLPTIVCGTYGTLAKRPKWWVGTLLGFAVLILGVWLWILLGTLVGAETD